VVKEEKGKEEEDLNSADATDAEREAIRKIKKYQNAGKDISDSESNDDEDDDDDTSVVKETKKMKDYFKKSKIYKKYENERPKDAIIESHDRESLDAVTGIRHKYIDLMKKYGILLDKVSQ
jgi:hypothetical protein